MKKTIMIRLLALLSVLLMLGTCQISVCATEQTAEQTTAAETAEQTADSQATTEKNIPTNEELGGFFSADRVEWAILVSVQGILMVFAVLALLWGVISLMKVFLHDIPAKRAAKKNALTKAVEQAAAPVEHPVVLAEPQEDDGEIVAAITAAITVMLQSEEYKGQFESGFRVVSFTRKGGAWNKDN